MSCSSELARSPYFCFLQLMPGSSRFANFILVAEQNKARKADWANPDDITDEQIEKFNIEVQQLEGDVDFGLNSQMPR